MSDSTSLRIASIFVFVGFIMTLGMTAVTLLSTGAAQLHEAMDPQIIINELSSALPNELGILLAGLVFDSFFIVGYLAIFYGLYVLTKSKEPWFPKFAFALGLMTGLCDLVENAIQVALFNGVPAGWSPDGLYFASLWTFTFVKDLTSYMTGMMFIVLLLVTLSEPAELRLSKVILVFLIGLYVVIGSIAVVESSFLMVRNLSFMLDMLLGSLILYRISRISD